MVVCLHAYKWFATFSDVCALLCPIVCGMDLNYLQFICGLYCEGLRGLLVDSYELIERQRLFMWRNCWRLKQSKVVLCDWDKED